MKKQLLYFALLYTAFSFAQVGINTTTPDASSMLDISATDKGVLVPRISLANVTTTMLDGTNTAATGLLIWNTNATTVGGNGVGFYFFNGTQWIPITPTPSTDDQNLTTPTLVGTTLNLGIENGTGTSINLASLQDGTGTDDQNLLTPTLTGTTLNLGIENGMGTSINLSSLQDGTGTDDQTIETFNFNTLSNILSLGIENDGIPNQTVDLSTLSSEEWFDAGSYIFPKDGTSENVLVGLSASGGKLNIGYNNNYGLYISAYNNTTTESIGIENEFFSAVTSPQNKTGIRNYFATNASGLQRGVANIMSGTSSAERTGVYNALTGSSSARMFGTANYISVDGNIESQYGTFNSIAGTGLGSKYGVYNAMSGDDSGGSPYGDKVGTYNSISGASSGKHYGTYNWLNGTGTGNKYGVYSEISGVANGNTWAGYFLGNVYVGTNTTNGYNLPAIDGTTNQIIATDGAGNLGWTDPSISKWTDDGTFIYPADGSNEDVVIGQNTSGNGKLTIDAGTKAASIVTRKFGLFTDVHYGIDNYIQNGSVGTSIGVNNLIEGIGSSNNRFGVRTIINGSSALATTSHYGIYNELNTTGSGSLYGTYNYINPSAGGLHYGTYNDVSSANGWAGYFVGKNYVSGNIGINNPNPDGRLDIVHNSTDGTSPHIMLTALNTNSGSRITFDNASETTNNWVLFARADDTPGAGVINFYSSEIANNVLRLESDGKVGIMRNPTTNALEVEGEASKTVAGAFIANSDSRLKKDITTISPNEALEKILQLRGVTYYWNDDKTGTIRPKELQIGFIAQEIAEVFPEKVTEDNLGYLQTAYGDYDPIVFQAIKALNDKIENLEKENTALKSIVEKVNALEAKLEQMNLK